MGKSDDSISRRRSKKIRKKQENKRDSSSKVSARVAEIIAAKKRRKSGKRRLCQGMCYRLPTPEDPFNDRLGKPELTKKRKRNSKENGKLTDKDRGGGLRKESPEDSDAHDDLLDHEIANSDNSVDEGELELVLSTSFMGPEIGINLATPSCKIIKWDSSNHSWEKLEPEKNDGCPSKILLGFLNTIQNYLLTAELMSDDDKHLFTSAWGFELWKCHSSGQDVLETSGGSPKTEQIAWLASTCADTILVKEREGRSSSSPFLLYLVPSRYRASKVREICKPMKVMGVHTVSIHSDASIHHQINGLKSCEPEFVISTPERLLELLSLKAIDLSDVSLLVIDVLEAPFEGTYFEAIKTIRQHITGNVRTVVFCDCVHNSSTSVLEKLMAGTARK